LSRFRGSIREWRKQRPNFPLAAGQELDCCYNSPAFSPYEIGGGEHARKREPAMPETLYSKLGGYDAIAAVSDALLQRLQSDPQLGRFWKHRGKDGMRREKQLLIDFLCASAGGPLYYAGRDMKLSHEGMGISDSDWRVFVGHLEITLDKFQVQPVQRAQVLAFVETTKSDIVE
jgi:hemoglobin